MSDLFWLSDRQFALMRRYFPLAHGVPRSDDRTVISGIVHVIGNGLGWRDAPIDYGPHKTLYNRSRLGVFDRLFSSLAARAGEPDIVRVDATHLKAHRTACSLAKRGMFPATLGQQKAG